MPFWAYMLHCRGGAYYTGHTEDLEIRLAQHENATFPGFTSDRLPVALVWSEEFPTRVEALEAERRIKGWSRAKKMALIRGDWSEVSRLAKKKSGPSTSSGQTGRGQTSKPVRAGLAEAPSSVEAQRLEGRIESAGRIDKTLAKASGLSRERVKVLMAQGAVTVNQALATNPSARLQPGAHYSIALPQPEAPQAQPQDIPLSVVYEDDQLIVVDKPAGMVVHPAAGNPDGTLVNALLHHCAGQLSGIGGVARPGIVHRIDKDTSGLLVVAKTTAAHEALAAQFADHSIHRRYLAVCAGHPQPPQGTVATRLGRSDANRKKMAVLPDSASRGKPAVTHYRVLEKLNDCSLLECRLETGRTHQVRVHCASIGHALLGDPLYGRIPKSLKPLLSRLGFARQALHAAELGFVHPTSGESVRFAVDLPPDMRELIDQTAR